MGTKEEVKHESDSPRCCAEIDGCRKAMKGSGRVNSSFRICCPIKGARCFSICTSELTRTSKNCDIPSDSFTLVLCSKMKSHGRIDPSIICVSFVAWHDFDSWIHEDPTYYLCQFCCMT